MEITKELLHELFEYRDGVLYWKSSKGRNRIKAGNAVCGDKKNNYLYITINNKWYRSHRLIFLMHYGYLPEYVDHIDNNPLNNRIENLRPATASQNQHNSKMNRNNTSGIKGISLDNKTKKWTAKIMHKGVSYYLGSFTSIEEASKVIKKAREELHGEFARHE